MSRILPKALVFTFVVGLSSTCLSNTLWACGGACESGEHSGHESGGQAVQTKAEVKGEKAEAVKDPVCGMDVSDIKRHLPKSTKERFTTFARNTAKRPLKRPDVPYTHGIIKAW